jgi:enterochelin esterase family protein
MKLLSLFAALALPVLAQDTSLHDWLIEGEGWKVAAEGYAFTDGLCVDTAGNLFFTDVKAGKGIYKIDVETGKTSLVIDNLPGISGLQLGPDGKFYACHNKEGRIIRFSMDGQPEVLLTGVKCNDLVVSSSGHIYFTETPTKRIHLITAKGEHRVADEGNVNKPNGISISPDQRTLAVSDMGGQNVWTWQIADDGSLSAGAPFMTMEMPLAADQSGGKPGSRPDNLPLYQTISGGDGMTTEATGRWFVTTTMGIQVFDQAGRHAGTLAKPTPEAKVVSCEFAGKDHDVLFIAAGDKVMSRKLKVKGFFGSK